VYGGVSMSHHVKHSLKFLSRFILLVMRDKFSREEVGQHRNNQQYGRKKHQQTKQTYLAQESLNAICIGAVHICRAFERVFYEYINPNESRQTS